MLIQVVMCYDVREVNNESGLCAVNIRVLHGGLMVLLNYQVLSQVCDQMHNTHTYNCTVLSVYMDTYSCKRVIVLWAYTLLYADQNDDLTLLNYCLLALCI